MTAIAIGPRNALSPPMPIATGSIPATVKLEVQRADSIDLSNYRWGIGRLFAVWQKVLDPDKFDGEPGVRWSYRRAREAGPHAVSVTA